MSHYTYQATLKGLYEKAAHLYNQGQTDPATYFDDSDVAFLNSIGARVQEVFDCVEDGICHGEPDYETFQLIMGVRRDYFLQVQKGVPSGVTLDESSLPPKTDEVRGMVWLPRLVPKALARLRGELPDSLMFCCGGDRGFFQRHDIHPAEFLRAVWAYSDNDEKLIDWVQTRSIVTA